MRTPGPRRAGRTARAGSDPRAATLCGRVGTDAANPERSPSGLWRRTGNAVWGNPSRVRIPPSPPPPGRAPAPTLGADRPDEEAAVSGFEIGLALTIGQWGPARTTVRWPEIRTMAMRAEALGFDTVWIPDELLYLRKTAA